MPYALLSYMYSVHRHDHALPAGIAAQDFLCAAQREQGSLKQGQRYWAAFALGRVQAMLAMRAMRQLLQDADDGVEVPIEAGALLLVRTAASVRAEQLGFQLSMCLQNWHFLPLVSTLV